MPAILNFLFYNTPFFYLIQSFWRDEAFSYFMAKPDIFKIISNTAQDFNPPLYYLILHFWILIVGKSDELLRLLSFVSYLATVYAAYKFAAKMFSVRFAKFVAIFTLLNPMLVYYAFELRMYSLYALFTLTSIYFFYSKNWKWYTIFSVLGLYTHSFFSLIILSLLAYLKFIRRLKLRTVWLTVRPLIFFIPWMPVVIIQFFRSKDSWMYPVDLQLIRSALGNLFTGFDGSPSSWWIYTGLLSLAIIIYMILSIKKRTHENLLFLFPIFLPLFLILGYSVIRRPIFVNRYLIFITVFEILSISAGIWNLKNKSLRTISIIFWLSLAIFINLTSPGYRKKTDFKSTFSEINSLAKNEDYIYAATPIGFLESVYYYKNPDRVFVYNPENITIPNYIGVTVVFPDISKFEFPPLPSKTYLIRDDASYEVVVNTDNLANKI